MVENKKILTLEEFHEALHKDIDKPVKDFRKEWNQAHRRHIKVHTGAHKAAWAKATVLLNEKIIIVHINLNFKKNGISDADYKKLKYLARIGIDKYWSRRIEVAGTDFMVWVKAEHSDTNAIPVDLYVETDKNYGRSMNPAILGIDASFIYNKGHFGKKERADADFMLVAAHEFGHSVLMYAGGLSLSWGHKGSTNIVTQTVKSSAPGYPAKGPIDLMKYYDEKKSGAGVFFRRITDSVAMDIDIKRLIWGAQIKWAK